MTLMKYRPMNQVSPFFNHFVDHFINDLSGNNFSTSVPAVNIVETAEGYRLDVAAPGINKENFNIALNNQTLTVSGESSSEFDSKDERFAKREFSFGKFERSFKLPETVDTEALTAKYNNGILSVFLPKRQEAKTKPVRTIEIA